MQQVAVKCSEKRYESIGERKRTIFTTKDMFLKLTIFIQIMHMIFGEIWYSATEILGTEKQKKYAENLNFTSYLENRGSNQTLLLPEAEKTNYIEYNNMISRGETQKHVAQDKRNMSADDFGYEFIRLSKSKPNITNAINYKSPKSNLFYNHTINNLNIIRNVRPKLNRKCNANQKRRKPINSTNPARFLEVFEVVEFDHAPCESDNGLDGVCLHEYDCQKSEGLPMGSCADDFGVCCVTQFECNSQSSASTGWFTNPGFPEASTERLSCTITLDKASADVNQIRLDFKIFELLPPTSGACEQDQFTVLGQNVNNIVPILCGINTGQHVYLEVGEVEGSVFLSVQSVSDENRIFAIKITQLTSEDKLAAPSGCLQYFTESQGQIESFNYRDQSDLEIARSPSYLNNLNYAMCIQRATDACSVTYNNAGYLQIVNYDTDGLPVIPPGQAGVEVLNCPTDWLLIAAVRLCGERLNDGSILQDFNLDAPVTDNSAGPIVVWFRSDGSYNGRGFKLQYKQNSCIQHRQ